RVDVPRMPVSYFRWGGGRPIPSVVSFKPGRHTHEMNSLHDPKHGLKVGAHHAGPEADANVPGEPHAGPEARPAARGDARRQLAERIGPGATWPSRLADPEPVGAETCMYTTTA